ncbi:MAG: NADH-quinone oxidoreductase subunit NuoE [Thermodesulfobacteriota bacterium]
MSQAAQQGTMEVVEELPEKELRKLDPVIAKYAGRHGYLIPALKEAQEIIGYLPREVQARLARGLNISQSYIYGVVSFYAFFTMIPRGRHTVRICLGTACYVKGAPEILSKVQQELGIRVGQTTSDRRFTLLEVRCLGACGLAPVMMVGEDTHGALEPGKVMDILDQYK